MVFGVDQRDWAAAQGAVGMAVALVLSPRCAVRSRSVVIS